MSPYVDVAFVFSNGDGQAGQSVQPVILYLTIDVSADATSHPILPINATNAIATKVDVSPAENALHDADEATKAISLPSTWEGAIARIKWVMDTLSPAAEVRHSAFTLCLTEPTFALSFTLTQRWHVTCY